MKQTCKKRKDAANIPIEFINLIKVFGNVPCSVSDPDPYHLAGSGSVSGNVDLDPGTKKKS